MRSAECGVRSAVHPLLKNGDHFSEGLGVDLNICIVRICKPYGAACIPPCYIYI